VIELQFTNTNSLVAKYISI